MKTYATSPGSGHVRPHEPEAERNEMVLEPEDSQFPGHLELLKPYAGDAAEKERLEIS